MTTTVQPETDVTSYIFGKVGYDPTQNGRNEFQPKVLKAKKRYKLVSGGEQGGKSTLASKEWLKNWVQDQVTHEGYGDGKGPPLLYWLIGASYNETIKEFTYIADDLMALGQPIKVSKRVDPGEIVLKFPGERKARLVIETKSATDITKMSKDAPHGIIMCEADQMGYIVFERAQGRLTPHNGWLFMSGTYERSIGWYAQLWEAWQSGTEDRQSWSVPSYSNYALYPGGRNDPKILELERRATDQFFMERIEGRPVPPKGLVFSPEFRADIHIQECSYEPGNPVYIWEDPGYSAESAHAVECAQYIGGQVRVFDELYYRGFVTKDIIDMVMRRPWWNEESKFLTSDPSYRSQHHSMTSVEEQWLSQAGLVATGDKIRINEGTERLKQFFKPDPFTGIPGIIISPNCPGVLSELGAGPHPIAPFEGQMRAYSWKVDKDGNVVGETPEDRNNHGLKSIIYGIVDHWGYSIGLSQKKILVTRW